MSQPLIARTIKELARLVDTTRWSISGLRVGWLEEKSLRQWTAVNVLNVIACLLLGLEPLAMALLVALGGLVLITELLNTAIETCVDYISTEKHPLAKKAKDVASGAVFASALLWALVWIILLVG
jgi:diacylglycerol kinase (ATP)